MDESTPKNENPYLHLFGAKDLVVLVTGGGTGIGLAFTAAIARNSAKKVFILGRRGDVLQKAVKSVGAPEGVVVPVICDITNPSAAAAAVKTVEQEIGYLDVLINNAGIIGPNHKDAYNATSIKELQAILLHDWEGWEPTFATNTTAIIGMSASFLHLLQAANSRRGWAEGRLEAGGHSRGRKEVTDIDKDDLRTSQIITVASISAFPRHIATAFAYSASKSAAVILGRALARLLAPWGIRSNVIAPGIFPSETTGVRPEYPFDKIPAGRQGSYEELASMILYLVGKGGAYVNGNVQVVDGGRLSTMPGYDWSHSCP